MPSIVCNLTVPSGAVAANLTDFQVRVDLSHAPLAWWTEVAAEGAGAIRVKAAGSVIPFDVVWTDTSAKTGELFFRTNLLTAADNHFTLEVVSGATALAVTDPNGRNAVWAGYVAVVCGYPSVTAPALVNRVDGTALTYSGSGCVGNSDGSIEFNGSGHYYLPNIPLIQVYTLALGTYRTATSGNRAHMSVVSNTSVATGARNTMGDQGAVTRGIWNSADSWRLYGTPALNTWERRHATVDGSGDTKGYVNGALGVTDTSSSPRPPTGILMDWCVGAANYNGTERWLGKIARAYIHPSIRSADWVAAEDVSWRTPGSFYGSIVVAPVPGDPENLDATPDLTELEFVWTNATGTDITDGFEVRMDGGTPVDVGDVFLHTFTGLTNATTYLLEVRAYNAVGYSGWVSLSAATLSPPPAPGYYRALFDVGPFSWDIEHGDAPDYGPRLPVSLGWDIPDQVDYFPAQSNPATMTFSLLLVPADAANDQLAVGARVNFTMYVDAGDPFQWFRGRITQLEATAVLDTGDVLMAVYVTSETGSLAMADMQVGYTVDWPEESIDNRVDTIMAEVTGATVASAGIGTGLEGTVPARPATAGPTSVWAALRAALDNGALENTSEPPDTWYGRPVISYVWDEDPVYNSGELTVHAFERRVYPDSTVVLDGCKVLAGLDWRKLPNAGVPTWAIVDGLVFGTPVGPPAIVRTDLVDTTPVNWSAFTRDNMGESLLPDGSTQLDGWFAYRVRYLPHDATDGSVALSHLVDGWASHDPVVQVQPVVITDLAEAHQLNGVDYLAGTLTGARLVIPPGGEFYLDLRLRPELLPGTDLP